MDYTTPSFPDATAVAWLVHALASHTRFEAHSILYLVAAAVAHRAHAWLPLVYLAFFLASALWH